MSTTAAVVNTVENVQTAFRFIHTALALTEYEYSSVCTPENFTIFDYIIIGAGSAGNILANRLTENADLKVLLIEAGGYPSIESEWPATFPVLPYSNYDYNYTTYDDGRTCQNLNNKRFDATQGRMLGGSGGIHHLFHCQGDRPLYNRWAEITGDPQWAYENITKYFKKSEQLLNPDLLKSAYGEYHGDSGYLKIIKQDESDNKPYLDSYAELGYEVRDDVSGPSALGFTEPLLHIADGLRSSGGLAYAAPMKNRTNLCLALYSTAIKILINDSKAQGVHMENSNGELYELYAKREVLVAAGAINTVKLLVHSGIGPQEDLNNLNIDVKADLPVGKQFFDHPCVVAAVKVETSNDAAQPANPHAYPAPSTIGYISHNQTAESPDVQIISLKFPHDSTSQIQLTSRVFGYSDAICEKFYEASAGRNIYLFVMHLACPKSSGSIKITSNKFADPPTIYSGYFENEDDWILLAKNLHAFSKILDTEHFKNANASFVDVGVCEDDPTTFEYWKCYALAMSASMRHYSSTVPMGTVLNSDLTVKGISSLRVVDSSAMPVIPIGEPMTSVVVLAERAAELVLESMASS